MQLLCETLMPSDASLIESIDGAKNYFLSGKFMSAGKKNGNGRIYQEEEMTKVVEEVNSRITEGFSMMGELNHPEGLNINLQNVSHIITELSMDNGYAIGKAKILNTPAGNIVKSLLDGGVRLGVSSRGTGNVIEGIVHDFSLVTIDVVAQPSGSDCYPGLVKESLETQKLVTLAEAVVNDKKAQKHLAREIQKFIQSITSKR